MTGKTVGENRGLARSGTEALALLAEPLNPTILRALQAGPMSQSDLRRDVGSPASTTLRARLRRLSKVGAVEKDRRGDFPRAQEIGLTACGRELLFVADVAQQWLERGPGDPPPLGSRPAGAAIKALSGGWSATILRTLAAGACSLTELDRLIASLSYPSLERRLSAMRQAGLVEARPNGGRGTPYTVTQWCRDGASLLLAADHWERSYLGDRAATMTPLDVETIFLLAIPAMCLDERCSGSCRLAAEVCADGDRRQAGVVVELTTGAVISCHTRLAGDCDSWSRGSWVSWLEALVTRQASGLEQGGNRRLAARLVEGIHAGLFPASSAKAKIGT